MCVCLETIEQVDEVNDGKDEGYMWRLPERQMIDTIAWWVVIAVLTQGYNLGQRERGLTPSTDYQTIRDTPNPFQSDYHILYYQHNSLAN